MPELERVPKANCFSLYSQPLAQLSWFRMIYESSVIHDMITIRHWFCKVTGRCSWWSTLLRFSTVYLARALFGWLYSSCIDNIASAFNLVVNLCHTVYRYHLVGFVGIRTTVWKEEKRWGVYLEFIRSILRILRSHLLFIEFMIPLWVLCSHAAQTEVEVILEGPVVSSSAKDVACRAAKQSESESSEIRSLWESDEPLVFFMYILSKK